MGASGWVYEEPYDPDIGAVLRRVRRRVFDQGAYYRGWDHPSQPFKPGVTLDEVIGEALANVQHPEAQDLDLVSLELLRRTGDPVSIGQLQALNMDEGTHSILDCETVGRLPEVATVAPFTDDELVKVLGSSRPSTERVAQLGVDGVVGSFAELLEPWCGRYLVSYRVGVPDRLWFVGVSGD